MKLYIELDDGSIKELEGIPEQILVALAAGETKLVLKYIGWATRIATLSSSIVPQELMRGVEEGGDAGKVTVVMNPPLIATGPLLEEGFLPYMSREERIAKGYTR